MLKILFLRKKKRLKILRRASQKRRGVLQDLRIAFHGEESK
jgi:hypothetical protein